MSNTVGDFVVRRLVEWGIKRIFGYPGDGINGILGAMNRARIGTPEGRIEYWKQWSDPRLIILVLNNRDLNQVAWEQRVMEGDPKFEASQDVPDFPYARYAELVGLHGIRVDKAENVGAAWDEAFATRKPVVPEAFTDPEVPDLPPHIDFKQAMGFATSTPRDSTVAIIKGAVGDLVENFLPHKQ